MYNVLQPRTWRPTYAFTFLLSTQYCYTFSVSTLFPLTNPLLGCVCHACRHSFIQPHYLVRPTPCDGLYQCTAWPFFQSRLLVLFFWKLHFGTSTITTMCCSLCYSLHFKKKKKGTWGLPRTTGWFHHVCFRLPWLGV